MDRTNVYVGTQGEGDADGIWAATLDLQSGRIEPRGVVAHVERPTWLLQHPSLPVLYAVSEVGNRDAREGRLLAFHIGDDGALGPLNDVSARGGGPTDLAVAPSGKALFAANFGGGQALSVGLQDDGSLGSEAWLCQHEGSGPHRRQTKPHPHGVTLSPGGGWLLAPDMGADCVYAHAIDAATCMLDPGRSRTVQTPAGSGPRLLFFGHDGRFAYLLTELSAELFVFEWDEARGALQEVQSLGLDRDPVPAGGAEPSAAALVLSDDGRHLYASNRRTHTMEVFAIDAGSGRVEHLQSIASGGERPWAAGLSPDGGFLLVANQASDTIGCFARKQANGRLEQVAQGGASIPAPTCICFMRY